MLKKCTIFAKALENSDMLKIPALTVYTRWCTHSENQYIKRPVLSKNVIYFIYSTKKTSDNQRKLVRLIFLYNMYHFGYTT